MRTTGVTARGIVMPIFVEGDNIVELISQTLLNAIKAEEISLNDGDILSITESVVARSQGNYATCEQIATEIKQKFDGPVLGALFPIYSRNRIAIMLKALAMGTEKMVVQLAYPSDEVGNSLLSLDRLDELGINPSISNFTEAEFRAMFGYNTVHRFTGVDYIEYYKSLADNIEIVFSNDPCYILNYTDQVVCCDVHTRMRTQRILQKAGTRKVLRLDELMLASIDGSGYNPEFGLLGFNKATEDKVKLFPRDGQNVVNAIQKRLLELTGKNLEVMIYGDGGFKDPLSGIWELHDPVVSPAYTLGLQGVPNELKFKYLIDNDLANLSEAEKQSQLRERIKAKGDLYGQMDSEGTTPRRITDLVGSLSDLISGSGDRGTPVVLIQGYFKNYASE